MSDPLLSPDQLRALRLAAGLTQGDVSDRLGYCRAYYGWFERGKAKMTAATSARFLTIIGDELSKQEELRNHRDTLLKQAS